MTRRMVAAVAQPAHQRARPLHRPPGHGQPRHPAQQHSSTRTAVFEACVEHDVAVEINSRPERRDPPDQAARAGPRHRLPVLDRQRRARPRAARLPRVRRRARRGRRHRPRPDRQHLAARPAARLGQPVGDRLTCLRAMTARPEVEVRRSQAAPPHGLGLPRGRQDRGADPGLASPRAEEAEWVETMVARLERSEQRRRPSDDALLKRGARAQRRATSTGWRRPSTVRWVDNQNTRWGSCTPGRPDDPAVHAAAGDAAWVIDYVLVHELAHLIEPGHTPEFWAWVDRYPKAERAKGYLAGLVGGRPARVAAGLRRRRLTVDADRARASATSSTRSGSGSAARRPATSARRATPR